MNTEVRSQKSEVRPPTSDLRPSAQLGLFEFSPDDKNVLWLEDLLRGAKCWMTAADLALTFFPNPPPRFERNLRAWANASGKIISGQKGYRAMEHASPEEIHHAIAWLESQSRQMAERAVRLRRHAHQKIG